MKIFTKHLNIFMLAMAIYTLAFRIGLSNFMDSQQWIWLGLTSLGYFVALFFTAFFLGRADGQQNPFFDLGLRFHISSYLIWAAVSFGWFYLGKPNQWEHVTQIFHVLLYWGVILICHAIAFFITRRETIRGIHKRDIF